MYLCLFVYVSVCGYALVYRRQKRLSNPQELELQKALSHSMWVLGIKTQVFLQEQYALLMAK